MTNIKADLQQMARFWEELALLVYEERGNHELWRQHR